MAIAKLTQAERKWLDSYRRELRDKHHGDVEQMLLYGSKERGDAGPNSDLDILVVEPEVENAAEEAIRLLRTLRGLALTADIIVVSERDADEWRDVRGSIIHSALSESRPLAA